MKNLLQDSHTYTFIDLFAGIGGIRLGFDRAGFKCVYSNDINKSAIETYEKNFNEKVDSKDIRLVSAESIPSFDILCAGFPCQPFSLAGVSARSGLGRKHGFEDTDQGNLFFEIVRIVKFHQPKIIFLENVANFVNHDKGNSLKTVEKELKKLGYTFNHKVIDASLLVPHRRRRTYMVATLDTQFQFPDIKQKKHKLRDILQTDEQASPYTISDKLWSSHQARTKRNQAKGNGFRHNLVDLNGVANTLTSRYGKDGRENLIPQGDKNPRMLTPRECARLMGFDDSFRLPIHKTPSYKQLGNSVCVPIIEKIAGGISEHLKANDEPATETTGRDFALPQVIAENSPISG